MPHRRQASGTKTRTQATYATTIALKKRRCSRKDISSSNEACERKPKTRASCLVNVINVHVFPSYTSIVSAQHACAIEHRNAPNRFINITRQGECVLALSHLLYLGRKSPFSITNGSEPHFRGVLTSAFWVLLLVPCHGGGAAVSSILG